ncbi:MAG: hypothetical protein GTO18_18655 [Anaerolineales bacterium]|nr:hypothetical protein [Anaerolineales bacterium]
MIVLSLPIMFFLVRWVFYRDSWLEFVVAIGIGALIFLIWWFGYGRKLPPPQESQIVVITDDDEGQ